MKVIMVMKYLIGSSTSLTLSRPVSQVYKIAVTFQGDNTSSSSASSTMTLSLNGTSATRRKCNC